MRQIDADEGPGGQNGLPHIHVYMRPPGPMIKQSEWEAKSRGVAKCR